jgi:hypothetical protein
MADLLTASGLQSLDPSATWNASNDAAYYAAAQPYYSSSVLGDNSYGEWGNSSDLSQDAATNAASGNATPNMEQYAGAVPSEGGLTGALNKYGADAMEAGADIYTLGASAPVTSLMSGVEQGAQTAAMNTLMQGAATDNINPEAAAVNIGLGGLTGGLGYEAAPAISALNSSAVSLGNTADSALVKGAIGAGVGALGGALTPGGSAATGALVGGASGAAAGAIGAATGNSTAGKVAGVGTGIIAGDLANKYGIGASTPSTASSSAPATSSASSLPTLPGSTAMPAPAPNGLVAGSTGPATTSVASTTVPAATASNFGTYSGYNGADTGLGYAPRQEANMSGTDWAAYGAGPELQFFQPAKGTT